MDGNNLPYGTPRFEKAFLLEQLEDENKNIMFMNSLDTKNYSEKAMDLYRKIIEIHTENYQNLLKKIKTL